MEVNIEIVLFRSYIFSFFSFNYVVDFKIFFTYLLIYLAVLHKSNHLVSQNCDIFLQPTYYIN